MKELRDIAIMVFGSIVLALIANHFFPGDPRVFAIIFPAAILGAIAAHLGITAAERDSRRP